MTLYYTNTRTTHRLSFPFNTCPDYTVLTLNMETPYLFFLIFEWFVKVIYFRCSLYQLNVFPLIYTAYCFKAQLETHNLISLNLHLIWQTLVKAI